MGLLQGIDHNPPIPHKPTPLKTISDAWAFTKAPLFRRHYGDDPWGETTRDNDDVTGEGRYRKAGANWTWIFITGSAGESEFHAHASGSNGGGGVITVYSIVVWPPSPPPSILLKSLSFTRTIAMTSFDPSYTPTIPMTWCRLHGWFQETHGKKKKKEEDNGRGNIHTDLQNI